MYTCPTKLCYLQICKLSYTTFQHLGLFVLCVPIKVKSNLCDLLSNSKGISYIQLETIRKLIAMYKFVVLFVLLCCFMFILKKKLYLSIYLFVCIYIYNKLVNNNIDNNDNMIIIFLGSKSTM